MRWVVSAGMPVLLLLGGCTVFFDTAPADSDGGTIEDGGTVDGQPDGTEPDGGGRDGGEVDAALAPDCAHRPIESPEAQNFEVVTDPVVVESPIKFQFQSIAETDLGIEITDPAGEGAKRAERASNNCLPDAAQAVHCGVAQAGWHCAFLTSRDGDDITYHAALALYATDNGDGVGCSEALSDDTCNWQVDDCSCLDC